LGIAVRGRRRRRSRRRRRDLGLGQPLPQLCREAGIGCDRGEALLSVLAAVRHQAVIGGHDVAGAERRVLLERRIDQPECVLAVAGAARNDPLAIAERGSELAVRLAVGPDRLVDAVAAVDSGLARWAERAAGARRRDAAMALDRKIAAVAQAHAVGGAALELLSFRGTRAERAKGRGWIGIGVGG